MNHPLRKVVIPAAGLGTRFLPATKAVPKEMLPIVDTPTIQLIVEEAVRAGAQEVIVVNGRGKLVGVFTDGDFRRQMATQADLLAQPLRRVMTRKPICIREEALV